MHDVDFQCVFEQAPGLFIVLLPDTAFTVVAASEAYLSAAQVKRADTIGCSLFDVFPDEPTEDSAGTMRTLRRSLNQVVSTRSPHTMPVQRYDLPLPGQDGVFEERYWAPLNVPVLKPDGTLLYIVHRVEDSTELILARRQERIEHARLVEANSRFQAIYDQGLYAGRLDLDGRVIDTNRSCLEMCGFTREEVIGKHFWDCGWWNRSPQIQEALKAAVLRAAQGESISGESPYFWSDGSEHVVDFTCIPIKDEAGKVMFLVATGMDITERVASVKNLRAAEILETITEGFFALDRDWRFSYVNQEATQILDRTSEQLLGTILWEAYPGLTGTEFEPLYRRTMQDREPSTITAFYPDHQRWYEVRTYPAPDGISAYFRNVTAEKLAERERERLVAESDHQRRIYEAALSNTPDLVYIFDLQHRFTYANEALLQMWGRTPEGALGKTCLELGYEPWHAEMHDREIEQIVSTRQPIRGEVPYTGTSGRRIYDYIFVPVLGLDGEVVAVTGTTRDVTDRKQDEQALREQAERLAEADRAKDEFLATLSHELRNPLAPLRNSLTLLRLARTGDEQTNSIHEMMERQVDHLVRLVDDLLETSRISRGELVLHCERVNIESIVRHAVETSEGLIQTNRHQLTISLPDEPLWVDGDPVRLAQIIANLLNNAAKYTEDGGQIRLQAQTQDNLAMISVLDNGPGIAPEALPRVFEMFSRGERSSGRAQDGLGIGLALARRLTEMHGGSLDAHSLGLGKGSEFIFRLPLASSPVQHSNAVKSPVKATLAQRRILVVDDNRDAANSLGMILQLLGAEVRVVEGGFEALAIFPSYEPSVVLLDIGMPGMDGYEVARNIRARFPDCGTRIVALTGWGQDDDRRRAQEAGFDHHLVKPAEISDLQRLLCSLDEGPPVCSETNGSS